MHDFWYPGGCPESEFDDFDLGPQCEEDYDDANYWESVMNEDDYDE